MSNIESTESYLNLNSDQFNSWLTDFESEFKKLEKDNLTSSSDNIYDVDEKLCNNNNILNESIEIEESSDSDDCVSSHVFISNKSDRKKNRSLNLTDSESDNCNEKITSNTSSNRRRLYCVRKPIKTSSHNNLTDSRNSTNCLNEKDSSKKIKKKSRSIKKMSIKKQTNNKDSLLTISQIDSMIPSYYEISEDNQKKHNNKIHKSKIEDNKKDIIIEKDIHIKKNIKLGTQALYRFIKNRHR